MNARAKNGGASAPPTVLPFPQTKKALRLYSSGMDAAGLLSLLLMDRDGEQIPGNVERFDEPNGPSMPPRTPSFILAMLMFETLPATQRKRVRTLVRGMAYAQDAHPEAIQLHNALRLRTLPEGRR